MAQYNSLCAKISSRLQEISCCVVVLKIAI